MKSAFCVVFCLIAFSSLGTSQWSLPVPVDSNRSVNYPLLAVSPNGQIALLSYGTLYTSDDNGRSFQFRYQFKPAVPYYRLFIPNGLSYDSNSTLWIYWAWDECSDSDCTFSTKLNLFLSRSVDGGKTFANVLQFKRGFKTGIQSTHDQWMVMGEDNTVHMLRDSNYYNGATTVTALIYVKIPIGDITKKMEYLLPQIPDSLTMSTGMNFTLPGDNRPALLLIASSRKNLATSYLLFTKQREDQSFPEYSIVDSGNVVSKLVRSKSGFLSVNYYLHDIQSNLFTYFTRLSYNHGDTLSKRLVISEAAFYTCTADSSYFYSLKHSNLPPGITLYTFVDILSQPVDSIFWGNSSYAFLTFDQRKGKYLVLVDSKAKSYFMGKDIITRVQDRQAQKGIGEIRLRVSPNPFNNSTIVSFVLPQQGKVDIGIYDISGKTIQEDRDIIAVSGTNTIPFSANELSSGVYIVAVRYKNNTYTVKTLLVR